MKKINIFCFGFGQVAKNFIKKINFENINVNLTVTTREKSMKKKFDNINYYNYQFSEDNFDVNLIDSLKKSDHILVSIPPVNGVDIVLKKFHSYIEKNNTKWITYLSATSIYGDHKGKWVNESSKADPKFQNGIDRLKAEKSWMKLSNIKNLPIQIFRLSGIYSNERNILLRLKSGKAKIINKKNHCFSRIHVEDIATLLFKSLKIFKTKEVYNISDDRPAPSEEVALYGIKLLGISKPKSVQIGDLENGMLKNFYLESKKVSNQKMKTFFNYNLKFPTYVEGLNYINNNFI